MQRARGLGDRPLLAEQYLAFVANVARGDFGVSFQYRLRSSTSTQRLPNSLQLAFAGLLVSLMIGLPLELLTAVKVDTGWDTACKIFAMLGLSIPGFFVGLLMIIVFAVGLGWLPAARLPGRPPGHAGPGAGLVLRGVDAPADPFGMLDVLGAVRQTGHASRARPSGS